MMEVNRHVVGPNCCERRWVAARCCDRTLQCFHRKERRGERETGRWGELASQSLIHPHPALSQHLQISPSPCLRISQSPLFPVAPSPPRLFSPSLPLRSRPELMNLRPKTTWSP